MKGGQADWPTDVRTALNAVPMYAKVSSEASDEKPPTHLTFLLNFFDELRRRAPAGGK